MVDHIRRISYADDGIYEGLYVTDGSGLPRSLGVKSFIQLQIYLHLYQYFYSIIIDSLELR